jgi:hypothetical protein
MSLRGPRTRVFVAIVVTLAIGFLLPPAINLKHFRLALSQSLSRSLNRQASVQDVRLRLLPLPGFTFRQLHISDDEEFGAEPILQTQEEYGQYSSATLRLTSLWRGRLEIASVSLTQASLNLVRAPDGHWNLERLINRAAEVPSAPTSNKKPEARSRFPYIELKESRINFKSGAEKKPFALSDGEFALWLAAENRWNVRLKAVPLRTDESVSDTGIVKLSGSFDRASQFSQTPFHFQVSWERPEVNAIMRIVRGNDPGWRGAVDLSAELKGTPADFSAHVNSNIDEFRRYDIARNSSLDLRVSCDQRFHADGELSDFNNNLAFKCRLPLDSGAVTANGKLVLSHGTQDFSVRFFASEVPVAAFVQAMLHAKSTLPADLTGEGTLDGDWSIERRAHGLAVWKGAIVAKDAALHSGVLDPALIFPHTVKLNFQPPQTPTVSKSKLAHIPAPQAVTARAILEPFTVDLGGDTEISGSFDTQGYWMTLNGPVEWQRLLQVAHAIGLAPPSTDLQGSGALNAQYSGEWHHFAPPVVSGEAQIRSAVLSVRGFSEPLQVSAGTLKFDGPLFQAEKIDGSFPRGGFAFQASMSGTRQCEKHVICDVNFSLQTNLLQEKTILALLNAPSPGVSLPFFSSAPPFAAKWLLEIPSNGSISAEHLTIRGLQARQASAQLQISMGKVVVHHLTADIFDGKHDGEWTFDFSGLRPSMDGIGSVKHARMDLIRAALDDQEGNGVLDLSYQLSMSGSSLDQLTASVQGSGSFSWRNGVIQAANTDVDVPDNLRFAVWSGRFAVDKQHVALQNTKMDSLSGTQQVSGEISFDDRWKLKLQRTNASGLVATGSTSTPNGLTQKANLTQAPQ